MTANIVNRVYKHSAINSQGNEYNVENRNCFKKSRGHYVPVGHIWKFDLEKNKNA